ncbi:MAG: glutathione S-transferase family protein [Xanthomonadales bacterium]|nr:glutathione S-transferase family protein [Gammaproteobacteria bacterium]MBT8054039.1 glutathione S-transferase family protein [Gammaproteobacteria bacterium]NND57430.1 glutathione S-transferase family protein [Xanthomonadales bacterium]NNK50359.1 glutathione S-transferase family protein [Xanthomonadales bacterium]
MYRLHGFFTQNTMKTLYVLEELGVDYDFVFVNLMTGENRSEEFRAMTPIGKVPVLEHDGSFLFESGAICRYVASTEKSPLFPADKLQRAKVDQWMTFFTCHPGRWLTEIYFEKVIKPQANLGDTDLAACTRAEKFAVQQLKAIERWFENTDWLANDSFSIAEPFALAYLEQVHAIGFSLDELPRVKAWLARLEARDSTARARAKVQPHIVP